MENLTDKRGINKGDNVIINNSIWSYYGFNENRKIHIFRDYKGDTTILHSLRECFKARLKYQNQKDT